MSWRLWSSRVEPHFSSQSISNIISTPHTVVGAETISLFVDLMSQHCVPSMYHVQIPDLIQHKKHSHIEARAPFTPLRHALDK